MDDRLAELVRAENYHLNTGFLSTPFILQVLADHGYPDIAFRLLEQDTCPSWLYAVRMGATTIWESWNGITPDGEMAGSLNHYAYGAVCDFLFAGIAGIRPVPDVPGYKHFVLKPLIGGTLTHASATYESLYGTIKSSWKVTDAGIHYSFTIPGNTTATVMLPGGPDDADMLKRIYGDIQYEAGRVVFALGSGTYELYL